MNGMKGEETLTTRKKFSNLNIDNLLHDHDLVIIETIFTWLSKKVPQFMNLGKTKSRASFKQKKCQKDT